MVDRAHSLHEKLIRKSKTFTNDLTISRELSQKRMDLDNIHNNLQTVLRQEHSQDSENLSNYVERVVSREWYKQGFFRGAFH